MLSKNPKLSALVAPLCAATPQPSLLEVQASIQHSAAHTWRSSSFTLSATVPPTASGRPESAMHATVESAEAERRAIEECTRNLAIKCPPPSSASAHPTSTAVRVPTSSSAHPSSHDIVSTSSSEPFAVSVTVPWINCMLECELSSGRMDDVLHGLPLHVIRQCSGLEAAERRQHAKASTVGVATRRDAMEVALKKQKDMVSMLHGVIRSFAEVCTYV